MTLTERLNKIDANRDLINMRRPLSPEEARSLEQYYRVGLTYSSNALEGNSLTLTETKVLLEDGITVGGKPIRDIYEATGHASAFDFMMSVAQAPNLEIDEKTIKHLHFLFYNGIDHTQAGQYRSHRVFISGTEYVPPAPEYISSLMKEFVESLRKASNSLHPVLYAAYAHKRLVDIHPFTDGNGRTARLLMNMILINKGYCIISIPPVLRHEYIGALMVSQRKENPSDDLFHELIAECELEAQRDYLRMFGIRRGK